jgi:uncharacterized protein (DUF885 family)
MTTRRFKTVTTALALCLGISACTQRAPAPPAAQDLPQWTQFSAAFVEGYFKQDPSFAVYQGRHEFDGKLPDWSDAGLTARANFLRDAIANAKAIDGGSLSKDQQFERDYLIKVAEGKLFWLEDADAPHRNISWYIDNGLDPGMYVNRPYAAAAVRMRAFIGYAKAIPNAVAQMKANLKTPMPLSHIEYAIPSIKGYAEYYGGDAKAAFAGVRDTALQTEFEAATASAASAMTGFAAWLENQRGTATQDFALGKDKFARMLIATEGVDTSIDELYKIGMTDLIRNQQALKEACTRFNPKTTPGGCMMEMGARKPNGGPVAEARRQLPALRQFLVDNDIVSIPGEELALVEEAPPYNRQNAAYIDIPGPYEKGLPSIYYIAPPDPNWSPEEQTAFIPGKKDLLFTSVHEVWPGHFLNALHANHVKSLFGRVFVGYAYAEGWAHYAEEMMWDMGFGKDDAETHIGQLSNALLRDCRFLSAIGLHTQGMTVEQSKQLFTTECYQDEGNARQQSVRGTYDPAYINYTLGKLLIRKLRDDWSADKGGKKAWKAFHDRFLSYGGPPIPLVRAAMMGGDAKAEF